MSFWAAPPAASIWCSACRSAAAGCSRLLSVEGCYPTWAVVHDFGPSIWLVLVLRLARARRRRPCELTRGDNGAALIGTDRVRCRAVPSCGQRDYIGHVGSVASTGAHPLAPPRWRGLVGWRKRRGADCRRVHGAVHGRPLGRLAGRGGDDVLSGDIVLGCLLVCTALHDEARACGWGIYGCLGSHDSAVEARRGPQTQNRLYLFKYLGVCAQWHVRGMRTGAGRGTMEVRVILKVAGGVP